jgi:hypothetical protein
MAGQVIARDQIFCDSIMNSVHHDMINVLSALPHSKDNKDLLLLSGTVLLYRILMHVKVVLSDSTLAIERVTRNSAKSAWPCSPRNARTFRSYTSTSAAT